MTASIQFFLRQAKMVATPEGPNSRASARCVSSNTFWRYTTQQNRPVELQLGETEFARVLGEVFRTLTHNVTLSTRRQNSVVSHHGEKKQAAAEEPACRQRQRCKTFIGVAATLANRCTSALPGYEWAFISEMSNGANEHGVYASPSACSLAKIVSWQSDKTSSYPLEWVDLNQNFP